jgi:hypothetical protein
LGVPYRLIENIECIYLGPQIIEASRRALCLQLAGHTNQLGRAQRALCRHAESRGGRRLRVKQFINNDSGYLRWVEKNPNGFVVNCYKRTSPSYLILHRATCVTIRTPARTNWTTTNYMKICSLDRNDLQNLAQNKINGRLHLCKVCNP